MTFICVKDHYLYNKVNKMTCESRICRFYPEIEHEYSLGQTIIKSGGHCMFREKLILAEDKNSYLFGTDCTGINLHCQIGDTIIT